MGVFHSAVAFYLNRLVKRTTI